MLHVLDHLAGEQADAVGVAEKYHQVQQCRSLIKPTTLYCFFDQLFGNTRLQAQLANLIRQALAFHYEILAYYCGCFLGIQLQVEFLGFAQALPDFLLLVLVHCSRVELGEPNHFVADMALVVDVVVVGVLLVA